jgi:DnaK suppressor protein
MQVQAFNNKENMFDTFKSNLLKQQKEIEEKITSLNLEEQSYSDDIPESTEMGTVSWQEDVRSSNQAVKEQLLRVKKQIKNAISKLETGSYGKCEKCKKPIEETRLKLLPTAALCMVCMVG